MIDYFDASTSCLDCFNGGLGSIRDLKMHGYVQVLEVLESLAKDLNSIGALVDHTPLKEVSHSDWLRNIQSVLSVGIHKVPQVDLCKFLSEPVHVESELRDLACQV